ncbi:MAG: hypothetical protein H6831_00435 [Planctomycetes bacterium]|nr:hypothetical protein [Planctomycetota bacterium]
MVTLASCAVALTGLAAFSASDLERRDETSSVSTQEVRFAAPVRLMAGDVFLGAKRLYASPAVYDWNGDGRLDVVIGDLPGRVTVALRGEDGKLAAEEAAKLRDGQLLEFGNW